MTHTDAKTRHAELAEEIRRHDQAYYVDAKPVIGDREYDLLYREVLDLEKAYGDVCFDAITRGRCVLARSDDDRVRIEVRVARRYDDESPLRERFNRAALEVWRS